MGERENIFFVRVLRIQKRYDRHQENFVGENCVAFVFSKEYGEEGQPL